LIFKHEHVDETYTHIKHAPYTLQSASVVTHNVANTFNRTSVCTNYVNYDSAHWATAAGKCQELSTYRARLLTVTTVYFMHDKLKV